MLPLHPAHGCGLELYIHIPFCLCKCRYCDFLSGPQTEEARKKYVDALICEIRCQGTCPPDIDTVFFGGGTPSVLEAGQIGAIMEALHASFRIRGDAEVSLEMNPGTVSAEKLAAMRAAGINRLSIGVQSLDDEELRLLGRIHTAEQAREAYALARRAGFDNINLDLMAALPGQTMEGWRDTLSRAVSWEPDHISAYSLIIEPGTPFAAMQEEGALPPLPDEDMDREMYHFTRDFLAGHGYARYEISNYARPGRACRHNVGYWTGRPYLGLGVGAASCVGGARFSNVRDIFSYMDAVKGFGKKRPSVRAPLPWQEDFRVLTDREKMEEFMFLGLRMAEGVREADFLRRFGRKLEDIYGHVLAGHARQGALERVPGGWRLTERGIDVSNYVLADYLL